MDLTSSIGRAQDALEAILKNRNILNTRGHKVPIDVGWPKGGPQSPEHIWIDGGVENWRQVQSTTGDMETADREETFALLVRILVSEKADYRTARDRALELIAEVEEAMREFFTLNGKVWEGELGGGEMGDDVYEDGWRFAVLLRLPMTTYLGAE